MTIDELARRAGVTTRNVRAYQERGLLAPPTKVGRTGYYDEAHLERLETIGRLLDEGFSLAAIRSLLDAWEDGGSLADVLGFEQALAAPYSAERPERLTLDELADRLQGEAEEGAGALARAQAAGLLEVGDDGTVVVTNPVVLELGVVLRDVGMPVDALAEELTRLRVDGIVFKELDGLPENLMMELAIAWRESAVSRSTVGFVESSRKIAATLYQALADDRRDT